MQTTLNIKSRVVAQRTPEQHLPRWRRILLLSVLGYEGAGALAGGSLLVAAPDGRLMDMPVDMMHGSFPDFFIPGWLLLALGVLNALAFYAVLRKKQQQWVWAALALGGLAIWFWIEIAILLDLHWLHAMWGLPVLAGLWALLPLVPPSYRQKVLLWSGIISSALYLVINIIVPLRWAGYSLASQVVSELSATGSPTRVFWSVLATPYTFLMLAFAWGITRAAGENKRLRTAGKLMLAYSALGFLWPFAPMHMRETLAAGGATFSDTLHIALGVATEILYLLALAYTAAALGRRFRTYSLITLGLLLVFGVLTFVEAPGISRNEPTPLIGIWERINIGLFMAWIVVLALVLLRRQSGTTEGPQRETGTPKLKTQSPPVLATAD